MKKHFVIFESPGSFVHETTEKPIPSWDVDLAVEMAHDIVERHNSRPFAFYFTTRERQDTDLDSKKVAESGRYFLGGRKLSVTDVRREMPDKTILIANMEMNEIHHVVLNDNSWRSTNEFRKGDVLLDVKLREHATRTT